MVKSYDFKAVKNIKHQAINSNGNYSYNMYFYSNTDFTPHFHKNHEFIHVTKGFCSVKAGEKQFELLQGDTMLISPNVIHSFKVDKTSEIWIGVFSSDFISLFAKKNAGISYSPFTCDKGLDMFFNQNLFNTDVYDIYILKSALYALCSQCKKHAKVLEISETNDRSTDILTYISDNFTNDITLESTAKAFGYEPHYFSKLFHDMFSVNFRDMINSLRIEKACELLEKTDMSVTDVALNSGFKSIRSFNRIFRCLCGKTPTEYCKDKN